MNKFLIAVAAATFSLSAAASSSSDEHHAEPEVVTAPAAETAQACIVCHGEGGVSTNAMFPILAGQEKSFLENAMLAYKNGQRTNPIMAGQVANLTEKDIKGLAVYFSEQKGGLK